MHERQLGPVFLSGILLLSACGGSSGGSAGGEPEISANGLPFAANQRLSDAEGVAILSTSSRGQGNSQQVAEGRVTLDAGFFANPTSLNATITFFGEEVRFTNGTGTLSNGQEVVLIFEPDRAGEYAAALELVSLSAPGLDQNEALVIGFETRPTTVDSIAGSATYTGGFLVNGTNVLDVAQDYEGTVAFTVNFDNDSVVSGTFDGQLAGTTPADMSLTGGTQLDGNGFTGTLQCDTPMVCGAGDSGGVDAHFYGPDAEELGGIVNVDWPDYDGVGTFIITKGP